MNTRFVIVMGVAGCGETAVGKSQAKHMGWEFYDADDLHAPENIAKKEVIASKCSKVNLKRLKNPSVG